MKTRRSILSFLGIATFSMGGINATNSWANSDRDNLSTKKAVLIWPPEKRPKMQGRYTEVEIDGPPESRIVIQSTHIKFVFENDGQWAFSSTTTPRYSIMMNDRLNSSLTFGIARFTKDEFLASLSDEDWNPYIESIRNDIVPKEIVYQHYTAKGRSAPYILKNWTRKVEYEYPLGKDVIGKTREIFSFIDGDLFVFIFSGDKKAIDSQRASHDIFLTRMNLYTDS